MKKRKICVECMAPMHKAKTKMRGIELELYECPKCKSKIFTEAQAAEAALKLDAQKLKKEYPKKPIKIGHSWGLTFPKGLAEVFRINSNKTKIMLVPKLKENTIEIKIE